jgi:hypothetical protein
VAGYLHYSGTKMASLLYAARSNFSLSEMRTLQWILKWLLRSSFRNRHLRDTKPKLLKLTSLWFIFTKMEIFGFIRLVCVTATSFIFGLNFQINLGTYVQNFEVFLLYTVQQEKSKVSESLILCCRRIYWSARGKILEHELWKSAFAKSSKF